MKQHYEELISMLKENLFSGMILFRFKTFFSHNPNTNNTKKDEKHEIKTLEN